ncbi:MAG: MarR family transcriptional regulator [Solirubrobacteraceae bacterium]|jgi:DNA-binding MarR family transcriptional regulator
MSNDKRRAFRELIDEVRRSQAATDRFDQAVADAIGVNRTDLRCLDTLEREGPIAAGRLAEAMGLTSGAITTVLDRLEQAGYARRSRDSSDRRRVLVETTPLVRELTHRFFDSHVALSERLFHRYDQREIELLLEFVRTGREFNERHAAEIERANRERQAERRQPPDAL